MAAKINISKPTNSCQVINVIIFINLVLFVYQKYHSICLGYKIYHTLHLLLNNFKYFFRCTIEQAIIIRNKYLQFKNRFSS